MWSRNYISLIKYSIALKTGINIKPWPVLGMYQPDAIQTMEWAGTSYLVTANEGEAKDFPDFNGFSETVRIKDIVLSGEMYA